MNVCATCKHWEAPRDSYDHGFGICGRIDEDRNNAVTAYVLDDSCGILGCKPDFGCTLWQARDGVLGNMMTDGRSSWPKESE